ncbi:hypothetical protein [Microseira sp. BLCC-F43]|uniref:hypothetical protein n=1 Tax=Microseira sp. BLCC-F43 TaxID=3153602 RepID=UPI0035BA8677
MYAFSFLRAEGWRLSADPLLPDTLPARVACTSISRGQTFVAGFAQASNATVG